MITASILSFHSAKKVVSGKILFMPRSEKLQCVQVSFVSQDRSAKALKRSNALLCACSCAYSGNISPASMRMYLS